MALLGSVGRNAIPLKNPNPVDFGPPRARNTDNDPGPNVRCSAGAGPLRAAQPEASLKTRSRRRRACNCAKEVCLVLAPGTSIWVHTRYEDSRSVTRIGI